MKDLNLFRVVDSVYLREVSSKEDVSKDLECDGFLIRSNEKNCRAIIASLKDKAREGRRQKAEGRKFLIAFVGGDDLLNRRAIETLDIDYLVSAEGGKRKDSLKQRDSGLNHVVAKAARDKGVKIVVDMGEIARLASEGRIEMAERIARIMQNVEVCRKAGCRILIASLGRNKKEVWSSKARKSFGTNVGMSSGEVRDCVGF